MAFPYTQRESASLDEMLSDAKDNVFKARPSIEMFLKKGIRKHFGLNLRVPLKSANSGNAQKYANYDILSSVPSTNIRAAQYKMYNRKDALQISGDEWRENQGSPGKVDLLMAKVEIMKDSIADSLAGDLFADSDGLAGEPLGLARVCKASGAVGSIAASDLTNWDPNLDGSSTALTLQLLQGLIRKCWVRGAKVKNQVILTRPSVLDKISAGLLGTTVMRIPEKDHVMFGYTDVSVLGIPVIMDENVPGTDGGNDTNDLYIVDLDSYKYYVHPEQNMKILDFTPIIRDQDVIERQIRHSGQWVCDARWRHGGFLNLDPNE